MRFTSAILLGATACGGTAGPLFSDAGGPVDSGATPITGVRIAAADGGALAGAAGDALRLNVLGVLPDGTTAALPAGAQVSWSAPSTVRALPPLSTQQSPIWAFGQQPTVYLASNPDRSEHSGDLNGVVFLLDPGAGATGTLTLHVSVSGLASGTASSSAALTVSSVPSGDSVNGSSLYASNCSRCHGADASGTPPNPDGGYAMQGAVYGFPAPPLNAKPGHLGADRSWNAALLAWASRADIDNQSVALRAPMPDWLSTPGAGGTLLTAQDFADIYAYLATLQ